MVIMTDEQFAEMMAVLTRIADSVESIKEVPKPETYGIRPDVMYSDADLQEKFGVSDKFTRQWRNKYGLKYHQRKPGAPGSKIWHLGQDMIDFYSQYCTVLNINPPKMIARDVPKGQ